MTIDGHGHLLKTDQQQAVMDGIAAQFASIKPGHSFLDAVAATPYLWL
ncbi:hypothetical protein V1292_004127 [Bradyrhizobium sp. AZCC 1719]